MHTMHFYNGDQILLIGGRSHILLTQQNDKEAQESVAMSPFRDEIISLNITTGAVSQFAQMPCAMASHTSFMIGDDYIVFYGGTNGQTLFNSVTRYDIKQKKFTLMTKWPGGVAPAF